MSRGAKAPAESEYPGEGWWLQGFLGGLLNWTRGCGGRCSPGGLPLAVEQLCMDRNGVSRMPGDRKIEALRERADATG